MEFLGTREGKIAIEQLSMRGDLEVDSVATKEGKKQNKKELKPEDFAKHIGLLLELGKETVMLLKCILVVCVCGLIWNLCYVTRR